MIADPSTVAESCSYCGLTLPRPFWAPAPTTDQPVYCCFGCRFAAAVTRSRGEEGATNWTLTQLALSIFLSMNVMVFTMALWSRDLYPDAGAEATSLTPILRSLFRYLCMLFALPVLLLLGPTFLLPDAMLEVESGVFVV